MNPFTYFVAQVFAQGHAVDAPSITIDWTISAGQIMMFVGWVITVAVFTVKLRDQLRDLVRAVGTHEPPTGLIGQVRELTDRQEQHHEWFIRSGMDRRRSGERRDREHEHDAH